MAYSPHTKTSIRKERGAVNPFVIVFAALAIMGGVATWLLWDQLNQVRMSKYEQQPGSALQNKLPNIAAGITKREKKLQSTLKTVKTLESKVADLQKDLEDQKKTLTSTENRLRSAHQASKERSAERDRLRRERDDMIVKKDTEIKRLMDELSTVKAEKDQQIAQLSGENKRLLDERQRVQLAMEAQKKDTAMKISTLETAINQRDQRIAQMRQMKEQEKESLIPDGKVLVSNIRHGFVELNIGRRDGVTNGLKFKVFGLKKGGIKHEKGTIQIVSVAKGTSRAAILKTADPINPILENDVIANPAFHIGKAKLFVLEGKPKVYTKDELSKLIVEAGGTVDEKLSVSTDFLIVGEGADSRVKQDAVNLGIEIILEEELIEYLSF